MKLLPIREDLDEYIKNHRLDDKWKKAKYLFEQNHWHPSLHTELLEPRWRGIYSFRIDIKYRALFFIKNTGAEVFQITNHYKT